MARTQLIKAAAEKTAIFKAQAELSLKAVPDIISGELGKGNTVSLPGFGKFEVKTRNARNGRHLQTGSPLTIAAARIPEFSAGAPLRKSVFPSAEKSSQSN